MRSIMSKQKRVLIHSSIDGHSDLFQSVGFVLAITNKAAKDLQYTSLCIYVDIEYRHRSGTGVCSIRISSVLLGIA